MHLAQQYIALKKDFPKPRLDMKQNTVEANIIDIKIF